MPNKKPKFGPNRPKHRGPLTLKEVESNLAFARHRAEKIEIDFQKKVAEFAAHIKAYGAKSPFLAKDLASISNLYHKHHAILAVTDAVDSGSVRLYL